MTDNAEGNEEKEFYLGSWKNKDAAEEGLKHLTSKLDSQGNELGALRKQVDFTQQIINDLQNQSKATQTPGKESPDYDKKMASLQEKIAGLDPVSDDYQKEQSRLVSEITALATKAQHEKTLNEATAMFKKELDDRDVKATHSAFYRENPDFNTPEMQMRIKEYIANDKTGMSDPLVAYREVQRDDATTQAKQLSDENAELKRLVELAKGTEKTGKVIIRGQTPPQTKTTKATGTDLDKGMLERLQALRE